MKTLDSVLQECSVENWDGYGAKPVRKDSYNEALRFIEVLPEPMPMPEINVDPDGEVAFEWAGRNNVFSVSVGGNKELAYAGLFGSEKIQGVDYFGEELPEIILKNIYKVICGE